MTDMVERRLGFDYNTLRPQHRTHARKREKLTLKIINAETAVDFNSTCITNGLLPKYTLCHKANSRRVTPEARLTYLKEENERKKNLVEALRAQLDNARLTWEQYDISADTRSHFDAHLRYLADVHRAQARTRTGKKLASLYGGPVKIPHQGDKFVNLSSFTLSEPQREFLNLGLNCHYITKTKALQKRVELELLLEDIQRLESDHKLCTSPDLQAAITRESNTSRGHQRSSLLTPELRKAAKELKENDRLVIRRADKSSIFVLLDKEDYLSKITSILSDTSKFSQISKNPTNEIKTKLNRAIRLSNATSREKLPLIEGDHKLGYAYGNVKTHKPGNPLRPIISQTPSVTYKIARRLNTLITPFTPAAFSLKSSTEFLDLLKASRPSNLIASLDVESLFTNVPVDETIDLICKKIYHSEESPLSIPEPTLRLLLQACTKEAPFYGPDGKMYVQCDGVAMGSPLGVLFANFYMGHIEEKVLSEQQRDKPAIYARYVDDIFVSARDPAHLYSLAAALKSNSCLNFTQECEEHRRLPFLDVMVHRGQDSFTTEVYVKATNLGFCLNGSSECPDRYRRSVIRAFVKRALTHTSSWDAAHRELQRVSQLLSNNGYPQQDIDMEIRQRLDHYIAPEPSPPAVQKIDLYYRNYMSSAYKEDEKALKRIIHENVTPIAPDTKLNLVIYYKTSRTANLVMKNSCLPSTTPLQEVNIVYQHSCTSGVCSRLPSVYVGYTTTTLSKRITAHLTDGAIRRHYLQEHGTVLKRAHMNDSTIPLTRENDTRRLRMTEAVLIHKMRPRINIQQQPDTSLPSRRHSSLTTVPPPPAEERASQPSRPSQPAGKRASQSEATTGRRSARLSQKPAI